MLVVGGSTISETLAKTELSLEMVEIKHRGLRLSPQKTEITVFGISMEDAVDLTVLATFSSIIPSITASIRFILISNVRILLNFWKQ